MRRFLTAVLVPLAACGDAGGPSVQLVPARFSVIAGANQIDTVARELKDMVALRVMASDGVTPVPSYPISWHALDGGSVFAAVVNSGTDGIARQRWSLGTIAGTQRLVARALDPNTGAVLVDDTVTATALPDVAAQVLRFPTSSFSVGVGDSAWVWIEYRDLGGNLPAGCRDGGGYDRVAWTSPDSSEAIARSTLIKDGQVGTWVVGVGADDSLGDGATISAVTECAPATFGPGGSSNNPIWTFHVVP